MFEFRERPRLGPYVLTRDLGRCALGERWLALHERDQTSHVAYRLPDCRGKHEQARATEAMAMAAKVKHPHILKIEDFGIGSETAGIAGVSSPWVVTPFRGDADGLRSLGRLLRDKGGQLLPSEAERAIEQLLAAVASAHSLQAPLNGPLTLEQILVDQRGSVVIELYGLERSLRGLPVSAETLPDEVRSIVEIAYELITGLRAEEPVIPASRLVRKLEPRWQRWFAVGLDPARGFETAEEAMGSLTRELGPVAQPSRGQAPARTGIGGLWNRVRMSRW